MNIREIKSKISKLKGYMKDSSFYKWKFADLLYDLYMKVKWSETPWETFNIFIVTEFPERKPSYYNKLINNDGDRRHIGYTLTEVEKLSKFFTFNKLANIFKILDAKIPVDEVIRKYKDMKNVGVLDTELSHYSFKLDAKSSRKFEKALIKYGMTIDGNGRRHNLGEAIAALIKGI